MNPREVSVKSTAPTSLPTLWVIGCLCLLLVAHPVDAATTPTSAFTDNGDGTVTHASTGLTWKRCIEGENWTGSGCSGAAQYYSWSEANTLGSGGWRLPTIAELLTIVERDAYDPTLNTAIFPAQSIPQIWSATTDTSYPSGAWYVDFKIGNQYSRDKAYTYPVRLVRGGLALDSSGLYTPSTDFTDNGDGTATHTRTGLIWKRCAEGQAWSGSTCTGTATTYTWDQATILGGSGWRLPSQNELLGLIEWGKPGYPAINTSIFADSFLSPTSSYAAFWSSSAYFDNANMAWRVVFGYGYDQVDSKQGGLHRALLVRDASSGTTSDADRVFNWAESSGYAQFFYPPGQSSQELLGYTYRYYGGSGNYLGVKDGYLWVYGPATQYQFLNVGALNGWLSQAAGAGF